ncbi:hypothetical protein QYM36_007790 [Artemia franciscana]|uniref:Uncharacterized protein n=1 Tax=Artemia franciscana TaxID=6661 RepID=A0AA88IEV2_ARTSF|nr:hypothetical protein QYM36_007790 [Artemia franciscana]
MNYSMIVANRGKYNRLALANLIEMIQGTQEENVNTEYSKRKKILHFSDGTLEVDEDEIDMDSVIVEEAVNSFQENINIHALPWSDWILHMVSQAGSKTLAACDYAGGALADFFGITSPKYYLEMEAAKEMMKEEVIKFQLFCL